MLQIWRNWIVAGAVVFALAVVGSLVPDRGQPSASPISSGSPSATQVDPPPAASPSSSPTASPIPSPTQPSSPSPEPSPSESTIVSPSPTEAGISGALRALEQLPIKGRAPQTGYSRDLFSDGWGEYLGCDWRNRILARDLTAPTFRDSCTVAAGTLLDPYSGKEIQFVRGVDTSFLVQIDHVVAVSDAWQKGAQQLSPERRYDFYNDPLNLLAVSGSLNQQKGDSDAASWLPPDKEYRCLYVARQIAVKLKYALWVTQAESDAMRRILEGCPNQELPIE